ncbi:MAG: AAA family ATPase, partial [Actinobacteria bacterium]|nr:AAA family ATPase [Actinomycetota bacterium]
HRRGWHGPAYELEVTSVDEIRRLAGEIGMFSKDSALANMLERIEHQTRTTRSSLPSPSRPPAPVGPSVRSLAAVGQSRRAGPPGLDERPPGVDQAAPGSYDHPGRPGGDSRPALAWDPVVAIDAAGEAQVYDLTVPGDHNFVAADIFVHNTAFALGMAAHAALEANRPVLFFSLEMSHLEITQRLLASEARVDSTRMRNGKLAESDWSKISHAIGRLAEAPIYIDDNPRATVLEIRAKSRRLKSRLGDLGMVVVDYLQLMTGRDRAENRQVEVSEISRGLKVLARELQTPVVALSQLSRGLELRADKRPMLADLRESGCLSADARVLRCDTGTEVTMGQLWASGERDIPVWTLNRDLELTPGTMTEVWMSGSKVVHALRLASGRRIKASANHPFLTANGWLRLDELRPGTRVAVPGRLPAPQQTIDEDERTVAALAEAVDRTGVDHRVFALPHDQLVDFVRHVWGPHRWAHPGGAPSGWRRRCIDRGVADDLQIVLARLEVPSRVEVQPGGCGVAARAWISVEGPDARPSLDGLLAESHRRQLVGAAVDAGDRRARRGEPATRRCGSADVAWDPVVSIEPLGVEAVFDATVAETHNFIANGIVVENSLEQDADVVIFLYRDELYHVESPDRGTAEVLVAKHRSGPTGMERLAFLDHYTRFANMAKGFDS